MYTTRDRVVDRLYYDEKDYLLTDRFYPGELGMVILLGVASLLVWSLCIYGITTEPRPKMDNTAYSTDNTNYNTSGQ
jgi:hypothetical protein